MAEAAHLLLPTEMDDYSAPRKMLKKLVQQGCSE